MIDKPDTASDLRLRHAAVELIAAIPVFGLAVYIGWLAGSWLHGFAALGTIGGCMRWANFIRERFGRN